VFRYEVRISTKPISDNKSFERGFPAKNASLEAEELLIDAEVAAGSPIDVDIGGLAADTHYFVAVRAVDGCAATGEIRVAEITTPPRTFQTVSACFIATAAYGTPVADEIGVLRRLRDRYLMSHAPGRSLVATYYSLGPSIAAWISDDEDLRGLTRKALAPVVGLARGLDN